MAAFNAGQVLVILFPHHARAAIHPDHALVEIFNQKSTIVSEDLLGMEYQSNYVNIRPGGEIKTSEVCILLSYNGPDKINAHTEFLQKNEPFFLKATAQLNY